MFSSLASNVALAGCLSAVSCCFIARSYVLFHSVSRLFQAVSWKMLEMLLQKSKTWFYQEIYWSIGHGKKIYRFLFSVVSGIFSTFGQLLLFCCWFKCTLGIMFFLIVSTHYQTIQRRIQNPVKHLRRSVLKNLLTAKIRWLFLQNARS